MTRNGRRRLGAIVALLALALAAGGASAADTVRIGLPTKTYWPTIVTKAAEVKKLFEKEGLAAEMTVYRGGAECFEALTAGAADLILDPPGLVATARNKGVLARMVAGGSTESSGWFLMVRADSKVQGIKELEGKKIGITSAGSGSDFLALWAQQHYGVKMNRVPLGGGGLVPNLLSGNVDAVVLYSPLSFQEMLNKEARPLVDFAKEQPANLTAGWIVADKMIAEKPQLVQKSLNAIYGALQVLRADPKFAVKLIAEIDEVPEPVAELEYKETILHLLPDGEIRPEWVQASLDLARLGGMTDMAPADAIYTTQFRPVPTKP